MCRKSIAYDETTSNGKYYNGMKNTTLSKLLIYTYFVRCKSADKMWSEPNTSHFLQTCFSLILLERTINIRQICTWLYQKKFKRCIQTSRCAVYMYV